MSTPGPAAASADAVDTQTTAAIVVTATRGVTSALRSDVVEAPLIADTQQGRADVLG